MKGNKENKENTVREDSTDGKGRLKVELSAEVAEGVYCNLAMIAHTQDEFVIDFIQVLPGTRPAKVKTRVIVSPEHAGRLLKALQDNIQKYEDHYRHLKHGSSSKATPLSIDFGGTVGES